MNKEVKEIVKSINTRKEYVGAPYMTLETKKIDLLLDYINQLETNIDEAIKELFVLKDMIYKPETREENFEIQRKISSILIELERGKE